MAKARLYAESETVERPPAFQEYAASALSSESLQLMTLAERGLFYTMRLHCWINDSIPRDLELMARTLGLQAPEVRSALTDRVLSFFAPAEDDPQRLVCLALVRQMGRLLHNRAARAQAGRDSAKKRREKRNPALGDRIGDRHGQEKSRTEKSRTQLGRGAEESMLSMQKSARGPTDPFVAAIEEAESIELGCAKATERVATIGRETARAQAGERDLAERP